MPTTILDAAFVSGPMYDALYRRIATFEADRGVQVRAGFTGTHPELNAHLASSPSPPYDIVSTHTKYAPSQAHFLAPLDAFADALDTDQFYRPIVDLARIDGRLYSVPRNIDVKLLHFRTDVLESPPATWDELAETASRVSGSGRMHGFVFPGMESGLFGMFFELAEMGGAHLFPRSGAPKIDNEGGAWALEILRGMYRSGAAPRESVHWHYDEVHRHFRDGHAAMVCDWPGYYASYTDANSSKVSGRFRVARMPSGPSGARKAYAGCHAFALTKRGAEKPEALELLRFLTSPQQQAMEARQGSVPVRPAILSELIGESDAAGAERWKLLETVLSNDVLVPPALAYYPEIEEILWRTVQSAITGQTEVGQALTSIERRITDCHARHAHAS